MNRRGHVETLVASHPGNTNAAKAGVYSPRMLAARVAELEAAIESFSAAEVRRDVARHDLAGLMALTEALDAALAEGVVGPRGRPKDLVRMRLRASAVLRGAVLEHDLAVAVLDEIAKRDESAEADQEPDVAVEGDVIAELVQAFHVDSIDEIHPVRFEAQRFLDVIATSTDPTIRPTDRRRANAGLLKIRRAGSQICLCRDVLRARDFLEFEQWVEEYRQRLTPRSDDPYLAAVIRHHVRGGVFDPPYAFELTVDALQSLITYESARARGEAAHEGGEKEEEEDRRLERLSRDRVHRRLWKTMLSPTPEPARNRLAAYLELDRANFLRKCVCPPFDTRLAEVRQDAIRAFHIRSFVRLTPWGAQVRVELPESYAAVRQMLDTEMLVEQGVVGANEPDSAEYED